MSEHQTRLAAGEIQFHQWCEPPLEAGEYHVEVTQTVQELADDPTSKAVSYTHLDVYKRQVQAPGSEAVPQGSRAWHSAPRRACS